MTKWNNNFLDNILEANKKVMENSFSGFKKAIDWQSSVMAESLSYFDQFYKANNKTLILTQFELYILLMLCV